MNPFCQTEKKIAIFYYYIGNRDPDRGYLTRFLILEFLIFYGEMGKDIDLKFSVDL